jgi:hypothetical protein
MERQYRHGFIRLGNGGISDGHTGLGFDIRELDGMRYDKLNPVLRVDVIGKIRNRHVW